MPVEPFDEMTDVLNEFPELKDPKTGRSLMERTVLIANTSDMPVAAERITGQPVDRGEVAAVGELGVEAPEHLDDPQGRLCDRLGGHLYPAPEAVYHDGTGPGVL